MIFYIVRLFNINQNIAIEGLSYIKGIALDDYSSILPREKIRLLGALKYYQGRLDGDYQTLYKNTKYTSAISKTKNIALKQMLQNI